MKLKWYCLVFLATISISLLQQKIFAESDFAMGMKLKTPVFETRISGKENAINFGFSIFTDKITPSTPILLKTGNLSAGGIISRMNSPLLSGAGTPFSSGMTSVNCISTSLPGISSYSKPVSSFFQLGYNGSKKPVSKVLLNCWYSPSEEKTAVSGLWDLRLAEGKLKLKNSIGCGVFPYEEKSSSTWILKTPYYAAGNHFVSNYSGSLEFRKMTFGISTSVYESPFGTFSPVVKSDFKYAGSHFNFSLSGAYNPTESVITSSDSILNPCFQLRGNLQYKSRLQLKKISYYSVGTYSFLDRNIQTDTQNIKSGLGLQFRYGIWASSITTNVNLSLNTENIELPVLLLESINLKTSNTWYLNFITGTLALGVTLDPSNNFNYMATKVNTKFQISFPQNPKINLGASYTLTTKESEQNSQKLTFSFSTDYKFYFLTGSIKIGLDVDI